MASGEIQPEEASISAIKSELAYSETERIPITEEGAGPDAPTEEVSELIKLKEAKTRRRAIPWIASLLGLGLLTAIGLFIILTPTITNNPLAVSTPSVTPSAFAGQPTTLPIQETDTPILLPTNTLSLPINTPLPLPTDTSLPIPTDLPVPSPTDTPIPQVEVISVENAERLVPVRAVRALEDAAGTAISIIISPDGQYLVASLIVSLRPPQSDIGIWKVANGEFVHRIDNISGLPDKLSFSIDEGTLIVSENSASYTDARLTLWNMNALVSQLRSDTPSGSFHVASGSLAISRDLNTLAVTHELAEDPFNIIKIRQHPDGKLLHTLESRGSVSSLVFSPDGQTLASATGSSIELWNVKDGSLLDTLEGHAGWVGKIAFSQNSQIIASSGGMDKTIRLWKNRKLWRELIGHTDWISEFTFSPDGTILASGSYLGSISDKSVRLWDVETGTLLKTLEGHALSYSVLSGWKNLSRIN